jgi:mTERF domain-containing protein
MLCLRSFVLTHLLCSSSVAFPNNPSLRRLLSAIAASPNNSFAIEDYLVDTCGLTRAQALRTSPKLSHLKYPSKPDVVLAILAGLSGTNVAALITKDPKFLCANIDKTLADNNVGLAGLGLSHTEIVRLISLATISFRQRSIGSNIVLTYNMSLFGSYENLLRVLKSCPTSSGAAQRRWSSPMLRSCRSVE